LEAQFLHCFLSLVKKRHISKLHIRKVLVALDVFRTFFVFSDNDAFSGFANLNIIPLVVFLFIVGGLLKHLFDLLLLLSFLELSVFDFAIVLRLFRCTALILVLLVLFFLFFFVAFFKHLVCVHC